MILFEIFFHQWLNILTCSAMGANRAHNACSSLFSMPNSEAGAPRDWNWEIMKNWCYTCINRKHWILHMKHKWAGYFKHQILTALRVSTCRRISLRRRSRLKNHLIYFINLKYLRFRVDLPEFERLRVAWRPPCCLNKLIENWMFKRQKIPSIFSA